MSEKNVNLKLWVGIAVSIICMILVFRKVDFDDLITALRMVDCRFVFLAIVCTFINYFLRAMRWSYLLISKGNVPLASLYSATIIGYMFNNLFPARLGELVRVYALARKEKLDIPVVLASLVSDRICDVFTVLLILMVVLLTLDFPPNMAAVERALRIGGITTFVLCTCLLFFLIILKRKTMLAISMVGRITGFFSQRFSDKALSLLTSFISGIGIPSRRGCICLVVLFSFLIWIFCALPIDMILRGSGIHLPITASMFIVALLAFASMIPASPGYIGTYHYACYKGLSLFGIGDNVSISIALLIHGTGFFPVILAGLFHVWRGGMSFAELSKRDGET